MAFARQDGEGVMGCVVISQPSCIGHRSGVKPELLRHAEMTSRRGWPCWFFIMVEMGNINGDAPKHP